MQASQQDHSIAGPAMLYKQLAYMLAGAPDRKSSATTVLLAQ
jgi:hypothetical protein